MKKLLLNALIRYLNLTEFRITRHLMKHKLRLHQSLLTGRLLDIGAGNKPYAGLFKQVTEYIGTNNQDYYRGNEEIENCTDVWIEDGTKLPFSDDSFDSAVCFQVMSLIKDPQAFYKEVSRILKTGGTFILSTDLIYPKWNDNEYFRHTDAGLRLLAEQNGFEVISVESFGGFWTMHYSILMKYFKSYPSVIRNRSFFAKSFGLFNYMVTLIFLPILSLEGIFFYFYEKNITDEFDYTVNNMIILKNKK